MEDFPATFNVRATDSTTASIFNEVSVNVTVIDENDFPPVFPSSLLEATLEENLPATQIIQLEAQDDDTGRNGFLTYGILSGDILKFRIDEATGILSSTTSFDYEEEPTEYQVVVYAEDDGIPEKKRGYCTVVIKIIDVNDWPPVFDPVTELSVDENVPVGFIVGIITATDRDTGDNAFVVYNLTGGAENTFEIDEINGNIKIKNSPDYETMNEYNLTVTAVNNKSAPFFQATTHVTVLVMDVNDNAPVFDQSSYSASINMINPVGSHVITVSATDKDQGLNGLVEYYILPDQNFVPFFLIEDMREGKITTTGSLPRSGEMSLTVMARDKGSPSLNATAVITLDVFDNSPFVPQFNSSEISISVLENTGVDYLIYDFSVIETSGKPVDYTIASGNEKGHFRLDSESGQLRTAVNLDYEEVSEYVILVEANENLASATEVQYASLFAENVAMLRVSVQDVNEEPVFLSDAYSARIPNSVPYKYPVITVQATDPDTGDNGLLLYSLVNNQTNEFDINENTGQIFTVSVAGKAGMFYLEVQATDQGTSRLTAQTTVNVTVDHSSSSNIVVVILGEVISAVERNIIEVKRVLEDKLAWSVYIIDVYSNEYERTARSSTDETCVKIIAFDEASQEEVPAEDVKRKLQEQKSDIEVELEKIFARLVTTSIEEAPADSASPELIATIVLSVLLACSLISFLVYVVYTIDRQRKQQQYLVKKRAEIAECIDNPWTNDKNGDTKNLEKLEHMNNEKKEMTEFSNMGNTTGGDSDKDLIQANENYSYLETLTLDSNSEHEDNGAPEKAAEPRDVDAQHTADFTAKQDRFLTDRNEEPALSLTPRPRTPPEKELKGVKFSEVAIILDAELKDESDTDDGFYTNANA